MIAQHPVTGKQIKIIPSRTQLWRDTKTVVALNAQADPSVPWDRWETLAVGTKTINALEAKGIQVKIGVFLDEPVYLNDEVISRGIRKLDDPKVRRSRLSIIPPG